MVFRKTIFAMIIIAMAASQTSNAMLATTARRGLTTAAKEAVKRGRPRKIAPVFTPVAPVMPASVSQTIATARTQAEKVAQYARTNAVNLTETTKQTFTKVTDKATELATTAKQVAENNPVATSGGLIATIVGGATLATGLKFKSDADAKAAAKKVAEKETKEAVAKPKSSVMASILELDLKEGLTDIVKGIRFSTSNLKENGQALKDGAQVVGTALVDAGRATPGAIATAGRSVGSAVMHPVVTAQSAAAGVVSGYGVAKEATVSGYNTAREALVSAATTGAEVAKQVYADTDFSVANAKENGAALRDGAQVAGQTLAEAAKTVPGHLTTAGSAIKATAKATPSYVSAILGNSASYLKGLFSKTPVVTTTEETTTK